MKAAARVGHVAAGVLALLAGLALGPVGCGLCLGGCPELDPVVGGLFEIVEAEREALIGGTVEAVDDVVTVEYVDAEGNAWTVVYDVTYKLE